MKEMFSHQVLKIALGPELEPFNAAAEAALDDLVLAFSHLSDQDSLVLSMRWGIGEFNEPHTLEEVAKVANCTRERVRQIEQRCLAMVRRITLHLEGNVQRNKQQF
jgi:DNA-directed RNA polymerase sigma subunit (sigma70/sigma32)